MKFCRNFCIILTVIAMASFCVIAQESPAPPTEVEASDTPNDKGKSIIIRWKLSTDDGAGADNVENYLIMRRNEDGEFEPLKEGTAGAGTNEFKDTENLENGQKYYYRVDAVNADRDVVSSESVGPVSSHGNIFHTGKSWILLCVLAYSCTVVYFIYHAKRGKDFFMRKIPGLDAVDEAIGRATEMGRSVLYVLGLGTIGNIATIASMNILGQVARKVSEYRIPLRVPCNDPIVMNTVREIVRSSYLDAGHPDAFNEDDVFFLTNIQFAYAAGVDGMMVREKPAAVFYQGYFYAESLIMAETGNSIGAIQIAGTTSDAQLPFFIAACDYTLIGEELYAASAYLSKDPMFLGSLRGQDFGKAFFIAVLILGIILELSGFHWFTEVFFNAPS